MKTILYVASLALAFAQAPQKLTLQEAEAIALKSHPQVGAAQFTAQAANEIVTETRAALYPTFLGARPRPERWTTAELPRED